MIALTPVLKQTQCIKLSETWTLFKDSFLSTETTNLIITPPPSNHKFPAACFYYEQHLRCHSDLYLSSRTSSCCSIHPSHVYHVVKLSLFLTYRRCKCSSSHSFLHTLPGPSTAEWNFCVETGGCSLHRSDRGSPQRWRHPGQWASARLTRWRTAGAGSPAELRSQEETGKGSGGAWPDPDTPERGADMAEQDQLDWGLLF